MSFFFSMICVQARFLCYMFVFQHSEYFQCVIFPLWASSSLKCIRLQVLSGVLDKMILQIVWGRTLIFEIHVERHFVWTTPTSDKRIFHWYWKATTLKHVYDKGEQVLTGSPPRYCIHYMFHLWFINHSVFKIWICGWVCWK